jgi:hypothetical protein
MDCGLADHTGEELVCSVGHRPRFYLPRGRYPFYDNDWGWKRRCGDFKEGMPQGCKPPIKFYFPNGRE